LLYSEPQQSEFHRGSISGITGDGSRMAYTTDNFFKWYDPV